MERQLEETRDASALLLHSIKDARKSNSGHLAPSAPSRSPSAGACALGARPTQGCDCADKLIGARADLRNKLEMQQLVIDATLADMGWPLQRARAPLLLCLPCLPHALD